jgi:hypothetical protein
MSRLITTLSHAVHRWSLAARRLSRHPTAERYPAVW